MKRYSLFCLCTLCSGVLLASPQSEAMPWTKSFLETRTIASVDHYSLSTRGHKFAHTSKHQTDGTLYVSSSPLPDWEFDLGIQGRSLPTRKFFVRSQRQLFSDLENDLLAVTALAQASTSGYQRCRSPVFLEMARMTAEGGIGVGRHVAIQKGAYTQLFAYLIGGVGSSRARYARAEIGAQQVFAMKHFLSLRLSYVKTFGRSHAVFRGIGTLKTNIKGIGMSYTYRCDSGIETRLSFNRGVFSIHSIRSAWTYQIGVSIPIAL